jgi:hypothetical protein
MRFFASFQIAVLALLGFCFTLLHPFHLSVSDLKYNAKAKSIEASIKININDFEQALQKIYDKKVDLINSHGKEKEEINKLIVEYLQKRFQLKCNGMEMKFDLLGFEREEEGVWIYLEFKNAAVPKVIEIENSILYDNINTQENLVHFDLNGKKKSLKVTYPEKNVHFEF